MPDQDTNAAAAPESVPVDVHTEATHGSGDEATEPLIAEGAPNQSAAAEGPLNSARADLPSQLAGSANDTTQSLVFAFTIGALVWYGLGVVFFCLYEGWSFIDGWYFVTVTVTTVGYGLIVPSNQVSRMVLVFYILVSAFLVSFAMAHHTAYILRKIEAAVIADSSPFAQGKQNISSTVKVCKMFGIRALWTSSLVFFMTMVGAMIGCFYYDFHFLDAIYWSVVTLSTVGYGDFVPGSPAERVVGGIFVLVGTCTFGLAVTQLMAIVIANTKKTSVIQFLTPPLSDDVLSQMSPKGGGPITREKYVNFMLVQGGFVGEKVLADLAISFDNLDTDKSGTLEASDFDLMDTNGDGIIDADEQANSPAIRGISNAFGHVEHQGLE